MGWHHVGRSRRRCLADATPRGILYHARAPRSASKRGKNNGCRSSSRIQRSPCLVLLPANIANERRCQASAPLVCYAPLSMHCFSQRLFDQVLTYSSPFQTGYQVRHNIGIQSLQVLSQTLSYIGSDQWLISGKPQERGNSLKIINHILRHPKCDRCHGSIPIQTFFQLFNLHSAVFRCESPSEQR